MLLKLVKRFIDIGTQKGANPIHKKHIRFTNSVALVVCVFALQNAILAIYYKQAFFFLAFSLHGMLLMLMPVFNYQGKRVLASAWFSSVAILFVTFYSVVFTLDSLNFIFLPMIIFLQFFLFSAAEKRYIIFFTLATLFCYTGVMLNAEFNAQTFLIVSNEFIAVQRLNSLIGLPLLSIAFALYAFSTIHSAEQETAVEKEKTEQLLLNILPQAVVERFKNDRTYLAEGYPSVTVLFADIVGFTRLSKNIAPEDLVGFLNAVFSKFDELTETYGLEKIKTIGDAYMVAGGVPVSSDHHTRRVCQMALDMQAFVQDIKSPGGEPLCMRIGISTGPVTAGVIGVKKFIYDLWGDTVNTASRMESHAETGTIQITSEVYELIKKDFDCKARGTIEVKGKGAMTTYFLQEVRNEKIA